MSSLRSAIVHCMAILLWVVPALAQQQSDNAVPSALEVLNDATNGSEEIGEQAEEWVSELEYYLQHPLDLNRATAEQLSVFPFLNSLQIQAFLNYRKLLGAFTSVYELQAIPGWDLATIRKIMPFVRVQEQHAAISVASRMPIFQAISRYQRAFPKSWGYVKTTGSRYLGSPDAWLIKCQSWGDRYRAGFIAEKDAGEPWFRSFNSKGFDHYGAYLELRKQGILERITVGDYEINFGQGLVSWQSFSLNHSAYALQIEKNAEPIRAHSGTAENGYYRGIAAQLREGDWQQVVFFSYTSPGAYWDSADGHRVITSWDQNGYHRTLTESTHRGVTQLFAGGARLGYYFSAGHVGFNAVYHRLTVPVQKSQKTYNQFAFSGNVLYNISVDYAFSISNQHFFGEAAWCAGNRLAFLQGWMMQLSQTVDVGLLFRHYDKAYRAFYANGFSAGGETANETGGYLATEMHWPRWQVYAYADVYHFPWWRYQISGPSRGTEDLLRISYQPINAPSSSATIMLQVRYRQQAKDVKTNNGQLPLPTQLWQTQFGWQWERSSWWWACRGFYHVFRQTDSLYRQGVAIYGEWGQQVKNRFSWNTRLAWFNVPSYEARIYTYERSVLYQYSYPFYYHNGWRVYLNLRYRPSRHLSVELRWASTWYLDQQQIGTGLDQIDGSSKHQLIAQIIWKW
ncbi:MAG: helix-hairpin-helix domain-containing protein [Thermoflavifilum sp.]|nr:helix-hairpin-helix domain-containing protein [Thermoflavifilum sp.]